MRVAHGGPASSQECVSDEPTLISLSLVDLSSEV